MSQITRASQCIDCVNAAINHAIDFAPDAPLERFLAQEIAHAKAEAFEEAGWKVAARHWRAAAEALGEMDIETRLKVKGPTYAVEAQAAPSTRYRS